MAKLGIEMLLNVVCHSPSDENTMALVKGLLKESVPFLFSFNISLRNQVKFLTRLGMKKRKVFLVFGGVGKIIGIFG